MTSSVQWIEAHMESLTTVEAVRAYLEGLHDRLDAESEEATGKERWQIKGEMSGISMALTAMRDLK